MLGNCEDDAATKMLGAIYDTQGLHCYNSSNTQRSFHVNINLLLVERFSIECHKTKTKVLTTVSGKKGKHHKELKLNNGTGHKRGKTPGAK